VKAQIFLVPHCLLVTRSDKGRVTKEKANRNQ
jgi:hypothetical protein